MIDLESVGVRVSATTLLSPVTVTVQRGDALIVRGSNGTGKSTLLRVLAGIREPSTGAALVDGTPISRRDRTFRKRVAAMIGLPPIAVDLTVRDHVLLVATTWFDTPARAIEVADDLLAELGLASLAERFPHELSSGQAQLFGLALVLARPFDVLLLDEPEQRLDPDRVSTVVTALKARRQRGATLVIATHSPVLADALADQTLLLERAA